MTTTTAPAPLVGLGLEYLCWELTRRDPADIGEDDIPEALGPSHVAILSLARRVRAMTPAQARACELMALAGLRPDGLDDARDRAERAANRHRPARAPYWSSWGRLAQDGILGPLRLAQGDDPGGNRRAWEAARDMVLDAALAAGTRHLFGEDYLRGHAEILSARLNYVLRVA